MKIERDFADFNDSEALIGALAGDVDVVFVQHTRQRLEDTYAVEDVIETCRAESPQSLIITDDNYAVFHVAAIGCQLGADISTFSTFKLLGPPGIGCAVGGETVIDRIREQNYSGGGQVQGPEAMEVLRSLVLAPVTQAVQGDVVRELIERLNAGEVPGIRRAFLTNMEERVVIVELEEAAAPEVIERSAEAGAAPHPVGANSRFEVLPMFYRVAKTLLDTHPEMARTCIRINPLRAGAGTVIRILRQALEEVD